MVLLSQLAVKMEIVSFILWNIQMDRLDAMSVVVAVQELGSLSAAARHLRMPSCPPSVARFRTLRPTSTRACLTARRDAWH